jgi:hypothetical protein
MGTITITPAIGWVPLAGPLSAFIVNTDKIKADATANVGVPTGAEVRPARCPGRSGHGWQSRPASTPLARFCGPRNALRRAMSFWPAP